MTNIELITLLQSKDPHAKVNIEAPFGDGNVCWSVDTVHQLGETGSESNLLVITTGTHEGDALIRFS